MIGVEAHGHDEMTYSHCSSFRDLMGSGKSKAVQKCKCSSRSICKCSSVVQEIAQFQRQVARWHSPFLQGVTVYSMARAGRWGVMA